MVFSSNVFYFDNISYWNRVLTPGLTRVPNTSILKSLQRISIIKRFHKMGYKIEKLSSKLEFIVTMKRQKSFVTRTLFS